ncbi:MAG: prepilin-type N-terminal cleavage/methylation domain-containing protein, partial [Verrucomicrobiota bacterium]
MRENKKKAFTLVELLVVVSIIALLIAILLPVIRDALFRGKLTALAANGRSIHQAVFSRSTEDIYITSDSVWPSNELERSSVFFHNMVTAGHMNVGWNFFTGPN